MRVVAAVAAPGCRPRTPRPRRDTSCVSTPVRSSQRHASDGAASAMAVTPGGDRLGVELAPARAGGAAPRPPASARAASAGSGTPRARQQARLARPQAAEHEQRPCALEPERLALRAAVGRGLGQAVALQVADDARALARGTQRQPALLVLLALAQHGAQARRPAGAVRRPAVRSGAPSARRVARSPPRPAPVRCARAAASAATARSRSGTTRSRPRRRRGTGASPAANRSAPASTGRSSAPARAPGARGGGEPVAERGLRARRARARTAAPPLASPSEAACTHASQPPAARHACRAVRATAARSRGEANISAAGASAPSTARATRYALHSRFTRPLPTRVAPSPASAARAPPRAARGRVRLVRRLASDARSARRT